ncbi:MAG TPA: RNA methyltransferase substrate-binding domain-containing protein, partial [Prolixibacteraceae bacterium]|nr:RNA methyltransferase substrate-binding domain-containing protein [Prolixibacteraceae bacterium]
MSEDFVFGTRAVIEAIRSGRTIDKVMVKKGLSNELFQELYQLVKEHRIPFQFVPVEKINRITRKNHQGVVALLASIDFYHMEDLLASIFERGETPLLILLDGVTDVRN